MKTYFEQVEDWMQVRVGKFTASEIWKLMQKGRSKSDYFGETAQTYIKSRLAEIFTQQSVTNLDGLPAIEWGNSNEIEAVVEFEKRSGLAVEYYGKGNPKFFPLKGFEEFAGGSPDGFTSDEGIIEVKAPYNSTHHINFLLIGSADELKSEKPDYYGQVQFNILCADKQHAYVVSYDPRVVTSQNRMGVIKVYRDDDYLIELLERLTEGIKLLKSYQACIEPELIEK